jgi:hypothetical protein
MSTGILVILSIFIGAFRALLTIKSGWIGNSKWIGMAGTAWPYILPDCAGAVAIVRPFQ